jgi:hypothetical protein
MVRYIQAYTYVFNIFMLRNRKARNKYEQSQLAKKAEQKRMEEDAQRNDLRLKREKVRVKTRNN